MHHHKYNRCPYGQLWLAHGVKLNRLVVSLKLHVGEEIEQQDLKVCVRNVKNSYNGLMSVWVKLEFGETFFECLYRFYKRQIWW